MKTVFTTTGLHARDRFDYWHDVVERMVVGHDANVVHRDRFNAELRAADLADIGLFYADVGGIECVRGRKHLSRGSTEDFLLFLNNDGRWAVEQSDRRSVIQRGEMVLVDSNLSCRLRHPIGSRMLMLKIPRKILEARFGKMIDFLGIPLAEGSGINGFLARTLESLPENVEHFDPAALEMVRNQLVDLVTHAFGALAGDGKRLSAPRSLAAMRLRAAIEARLTEPTLNSERAARAAGMSVRYANSLLESEGTSVARLIRELRLDRCRIALLDPAQDHRTISEIAFGWGFSDLTHFGRLFGAAFGLTPRAFRQGRSSEIEAPPLIVKS